eukprot:4553499-Amphidinium_carterae.1
MEHDSMQVDIDEGIIDSLRQYGQASRMQFSSPLLEFLLVDDCSLELCLGYLRLPLFPISVDPLNARRSSLGLTTSRCLSGLVHSYRFRRACMEICLLYTSDAADDTPC